MLQDGWTGVLAAARYGHADVVRDLVNDFGCDKDAVKEVCWRSRAGLVQL